MKCKENKIKHESKEALQKSQAAARKFFAPRAPNVPPTVSEPPRVQAVPIPSGGPDIQTARAPVMQVNEM